MDTSFSYGRSSPSLSDDPTDTNKYSKSTSGFSTQQSRHPGQHLDDADLLALKRQYVHMSNRESSMISSSNDDLSQLLERNPIHFDLSQHDYADMDEDDLHLDSSPGYDYETDIRDKLKKANEDLKHDSTPAELTHPQRVSFDVVVKAVNIYQDPAEYSDGVPPARVPTEPVIEESSVETIESKEDAEGKLYTVPLNDTKPREGPTLLQQIKSVQFHGGALPSDHWGSARAQPRNNDDITEENPSSGMANSDEISHLREESTSSEQPMLVSINGTFELQSKGEYTAEESRNLERTSKIPSVDVKSSTETSKNSAESNKTFDESNKLNPIRNRPASSGPYGSSSRSISSGSSKSDTNRPVRVTSALPSKESHRTFLQQSSGVDFNERNKKYLEQKRAELKEKKRIEEEERKKREEQKARGQEVFLEWTRAKDAERQRLEEEKRLEREEQKSRDDEKNRELEKLREKKQKEWIERKDREVMIANEFRRLQTSDDLTDAPTSNAESQRAFNRWLRKKYEQAKEEKRQLRLEERRLRRRQRRSIKRFQLQQDLQLAKSFGYT